MTTANNLRMNTHDKRLRKKEAKRSRLRRIADGEDVEDEEEDEYSDDSEDDDGTDRREEVRVNKLSKTHFKELDEGNFNGLPFSRQFWMDILQEKPVGPSKGASSMRKKVKKVHSIMTIWCRKQFSNPRKSDIDISIIKSSKSTKSAY